MKRTRFGSRDRLSRDAAELQRLATGLSESGGKLEDSFWENQLAELVERSGVRHSVVFRADSGLVTLLDSRLRLAANHS